LNPTAETVAIHLTAAERITGFFAPAAISLGMAKDHSELMRPGPEDQA
jgi:hypothetical protein